MFESIWVDLPHKHIFIYYFHIVILILLDFMRDGVTCNPLNGVFWALM